MRVEGLAFPEAVRVTAQEVGVEIKEAVGGDTGRSSRLVGANDAALEHFRASLRGRDGASARRYLEGRGISADLIERFEIGCAPSGWEGLFEHLRKAGISGELAEQAGLVARRKNGEGWYDRFRDRVVFPIRDAGGRLVGFGGRSLDPDAPKYLNTPETPLYHKGQVLFGLPQALDAFRQRDRAVVVEGYFDVLALHRAGIREAVAPCGTALTSDHARRLRRYVREVLLLFDGDEAGRRAAERALPVLLSADLRVRGVSLPPGEDPDTIVVGQDGAGALRTVLEKAEPLLDQFLEGATRKNDGHAWNVSDAVQGLAPYLLALPDPVERESYTRTLASRLGLSVAAVQEAIRRRADPRARGNQAEATPSDAPLEIDAVTRTLVSILVSEPSLAERVTELDTESLPSREARELLERVLEAVRSHAEQALAPLLSPGEGRIAADAKALLSRIVLESAPLDGAAAEQVLQACRTRLGIRALDRESREINARLGACASPDEERALLEAKQEMLRKRRILLSEERRV
jgi:DNA primase